MTRGADVASTALAFKRLIGSASFLRWQILGGLDGGNGGPHVKEVVVQPLVLEVAFFFGNPLLESHVRCDHKLCHGFLRTSCDSFSRNSSRSNSARYLASLTRLAHPNTAQVIAHRLARPVAITGLDALEDGKVGRLDPGRNLRCGVCVPLSRPYHMTQGSKQSR